MKRKRIQSKDMVIVNYYSPNRIESIYVSRNIGIISRGFEEVNKMIEFNVWRANTRFNLTHIYSPVMESKVISAYISVNTKVRTFFQIVKYIYRHYKPSPKVLPFIKQESVSNAANPFVSSRFIATIQTSKKKMFNKVKYMSAVSSVNKSFITGGTFTLKGRIQTEPIKPRKTVQTVIVGSHSFIPSRTSISQNYAFLPHTKRGVGIFENPVQCSKNIRSSSSRTSNSIYGLGSYSISVTITGGTYSYIF